jgi:hypothetical protein
MMSFRKFLLSEEDLAALQAKWQARRDADAKRYRNPDWLLGDESIAFYFSNKSIAYSKPGKEHRSISWEHGRQPHGKQVNAKTWRGSGVLRGRVGKENAGDDYNWVSFWNDESEDYIHLLQPCLAKLREDGLINDQSKLSTPLLGTVPINHGTTGQKELSAEEKEKHDLALRMHTMTGAAKQYAMKLLGVGGGGKPHPIQAAMIKHDLLKPGQKWWAPHSESNLFG